jgi:hypothetical protein
MRRLIIGALSEPRWTKPFGTLVSIRVAFWVGAALTLLWAPLRSGIPPFRAYEARSDLLFGTFAQWDSGWFVRIADNGYDVPATSAFFPLYPLLVHALSFVTRSTVVAGVLLSLVAAGIAAVLIAEIARPLLGDQGARRSVLYVALYPIAFVFTGVYSDALFLAATSGAFLAASRGRPVVAGILGALAVATRLVGLALFPALLVLLWPRSKELRDVLRPLSLLLLPAALAAYMLYLEYRFGDPLAFAHAQQTYWLRDAAALGPLGGLWESLSAGWHGAAELVRHLPRTGGYPEGFPQRDQFAIWNVLHLLVAVAALALTWIAWRRLGPALGLYALTLNALLLTATVDVFPLASLPRYLIANFPLFIALAAVTENRPRGHEVVIALFAAVGAVAAVAFARGVWIA